MKKNIIYTFLFSILLLAGCAKEPGGGVYVENDGTVSFSLTKAGNIPVNTTFGFIAYPYDTSTSTEPAGGLSGAGTYRYSPSERLTLIPCTTDEDGNKTSDYTAAAGMALADASKNAPYNVYMYTPGVPVDNSTGSIRIKYKRTVPLKVSVTTFPLQVNNYQAYDISDFTANTTLREMTSLLTFEFVPEKTTTFSIASSGLLRYVGEYAYYHPLLNVSSLEGQIASNGYPTEAAISFISGTGHSGNARYVSSEAVRVFPADYSMNSIKPLTLSFSLTVGAKTSATNVPLAIKIEPGMVYNVKIRVSSSLLTLSYTITPWTGQNSSAQTGDVGGTGTTVYYGTFTVNSWDPGHSGSEIGDNIG